MSNSEPEKYADDVVIDKIAVNHIWKRVLLFTVGFLAFGLSYYVADHQTIGRYVAETQGMPLGVAYYSTILAGMVSATLIGVGLMLVLSRTRIIAPYIVLFLMGAIGNDPGLRFGEDKEAHAVIALNPVHAGTGTVNWYAAFHNNDPHGNGMPRWMEMSDHMRSVVVEKTDEQRKLFLK